MHHAGTALLVNQSDQRAGQPHHRLRHGVEPDPVPDPHSIALGINPSPPPIEPSCAVQEPHWSGRPAAAVRSGQTALAGQAVAGHERPAHTQAAHGGGDRVADEREDRAAQNTAGQHHLDLMWNGVSSVSTALRWCVRLQLRLRWFWGRRSGRPRGS
jgi:hypothetical protein